MTLALMGVMATSAFAVPEGSSKIVSLNTRTRISVATPVAPAVRERILRRRIVMEIHRLGEFAAPNEDLDVLRDRVRRIRKAMALHRLGVFVDWREHTLRDLNRMSNLAATR